MVIMILILPTAVNAATTVDFSGVVLTTKDSNITYTLKISTDEQVKTLDANLEYDKEVFELVGITQEKKWSQQGTNTLSFESGVDYSDYSQNTDGTLKQKETFSVAKIVFKVIKDDTTSSIKIKNIYATDVDGEEVKLTKTELSKNVSIKSSDNNLKSLAVNDEAITLQDDVLEYELTVDATIEKVTITAVKNSSLAEFVSGFGSRTEDLKYGENEILVKVKAESGVTKTYIIKITREDDRNSNCDLKSIIINNGSIEFDNSKLSSQTKYTFHTFKLDNVEISAEPYDAKSKVEIKYPDEFVIGTNVITITVTSESDSKKEYELTFINEDELTSTFLSELRIAGYEDKLNFDKNANDYTIKYNPKYKKTAIKVSAESSAVTLYLDGKEIASGTTVNYEIKPGSTITIEVKPNSDSPVETRTYTIHVEEDTSINFYLILEAVISMILVICIIVVSIKRKNIVKKLKQV